MGRYARATALALIVGSWGSSGRAADGPPPEQDSRGATSQSTPVRLISVSEPVDVLLELALDEQGRVTEVIVVSGTGEVAAAAARDAETWTFYPELRQGVPIRSRVQYVVHYEPAARRTERAAESGAELARAEAAHGSAEATTEVIVRGVVHEPLSTTFTRAEVRNLAGAFGDPLRAVEIMPGVTPIASGLPMFFVRGAPPGNVGYFVDGIRVPLLYHAFLGPSVIHPALLEDVTLYAGPMPTRLGRFAGAAVEAGLAQPQEEFRGEASLRLFDAGAFVEAPIPGGKGYAMAGARYSYTALLFSLLSAAGEANYWDYQFLGGYRLTPKDRIRVLALGARDSGSQNGAGLDTEYHRIDLKFEHDFDAGTSSRIHATLGHDRFLTPVGFVKDTLVLGRAGLDATIGETKLRTGGDISIDNYDLELSPIVITPEVWMTLFPKRTDVSGGIYADWALPIGRRMTFIPGIRVDAFSSMGATEVSVDPRVYLDYRISPQVRISEAVGMAHQSPNFVPAVPAAQVAGLKGGLQESLHAESKVTVDLPWSITASLAAFINGSTRLSDPISRSQSFAFDETSAEQRSQAEAAGFELFVKRPLTGRLGGTLSYTWMGSLRTFESIRTVPGYDRTHTLNLALSYDFGAQFRLSVKMALASGIPGRNLDPRDGDKFIYTGSRSAPFFRLDAKLEKRFRLTEHTTLGFNAEVLNAAFTSNATTRTCSLDGCTDNGAAPLLIPSIGAELVWY